jgi:hypothetical protein
LIPSIGADNPTYLKEKGDKVVTFVALTIGTFGFLTIVKGMYDMSFGLNKK